jgi:serine/threonine-protein kinase RsbT
MAGSFPPDGQNRIASGLSPVNGTREAHTELPGRRWPAASHAPRESLTSSASEVRVHIDSDRAIVEARRQGRRLAAAAGLKATDLTIIATVISELARNVLLFATSGDIVVELVRHGSRQGVVVIVTDSGPGIVDIPRALQDGYSTAGRLGLGLPGVKRLMDDFEISSAPGAGTTVIARKWTR